MNQLRTLLLLGFVSISSAMFLAGRNSIGDEFTVDGRHPRLSGAMEALQFWNRSRAYPAADIPADAYFRAWTAYRSMNAMRKPTLDVEPWRAIGPTNVGGRTKCIEINPLNPNTIYAGSASGGLWRSHSAGIGAEAWHRVPTGFPALGVSAVAISPADTNVLYAGTGEVYGYQFSIGGVYIRTTRGSYGIGILKSTDAGKTWRTSLDWTYNQQRGVQCIRLNPRNPDVVYAGTSEGIFKSFDAGATWTRIHDVIMTSDIQIHPADTNLVLAASGNLFSAGHGIYRSTDAGATWSRTVNGLPPGWRGKANLSVYQASPNVVYASIGNGVDASNYNNNGTILAMSTDFGLNWTTKSARDYAIYQGWYSHFAAVDPADSTILFCGGIYVWKWDPRGDSLVQITSGSWYQDYPAGGREGPDYYVHADNHCLTFHPSDPRIFYISGDGGVFRTTNGGGTFSGCNGGYQTTQFYKRFSSSAVDSLLALGGLQDNSSVMYIGKPAWRRVLVGDGCCTALHPSDSAIMYGSSQYLRMYRSTTHGRNWVTLTLPSSTNPPFIAPFTLAGRNARFMYAASEKVFRSSDGGGIWLTANGGKALNGDAVITLSVAPSDSFRVYAATAPDVHRATLFVTRNGGASWSDITGFLPDRYCMDLAAHPSNPDIVYAVFAGFGSSHVFKSTNAGTSWTDIGGMLPDVPATAIAIDPVYPEHVYLGNDLGVFLSTDAGATWRSYSDGLQDVAFVMDLSISPRNRALRAATHGNGVYERPLFGGAVSGLTSLSMDGGLILEQNHPNPASVETAIRYTIPRAGPTRLMVSDVMGRIVFHRDCGMQPPGTHSVVIPRGTLPAGSYAYRLVSGSSALQRMLQFR